MYNQIPRKTNPSRATFRKCQEKCYKDGFCKNILSSTLPNMIPFRAYGFMLGLFYSYPSFTFEISPSSHLWFTRCKPEQLAILIDSYLKNWLLNYETVLTMPVVTSQGDFPKCLLVYVNFCCETVVTMLCWSR